MGGSQALEGERERCFMSMYKYVNVDACFSRCKLNNVNAVKITFRFCGSSTKNKNETDISRFCNIQGSSFLLVSNVHI